MNYSVKECRLKTLNWKLLTAFEAVARHRNFTSAARELNVQQPSISRRVADLEADLGVTLLFRTRPLAELTDEGRVLFRAISKGVAKVTDAVEQITTQQDRNVVVVNTTIGFASCYLMQRLAQFRMEHPDIAIELVSRDQNETYRTTQSDVLILFDDPANLPALPTHRIFSEELIPVAKPGAFSNIENALTDLEKMPLLRLTAGVHAEDWARYFE